MASVKIESGKKGKKKTKIPNAKGQREKNCDISVRAHFVSIIMYTYAESQRILTTAFVFYVLNQPIAQFYG